MTLPGDDFDGSRMTPRGAAAIIAMMFAATGAAAPAPQPANGSGTFGLYAARDFRLTTGECRDCPTIRQALWYFRDQVIAVPLPGHPRVGFRDRRARDRRRAPLGRGARAGNADRLSAARVGGRTRRRARRQVVGRCVATRHGRRFDRVPAHGKNSAQSFVLRRVIGRVLPPARADRTWDADRQRIYCANVLARGFPVGGVAPPRARCRPACLRRKDCAA